MEEYTEWRLIARVPDVGIPTELVLEEVRELVPEDVDIHQRGRTEILVYAFEENEIREVERVLRWRRWLIRQAVLGNYAHGVSGWKIGDGNGTEAKRPSA